MEEWRCISGYNGVYEVSSQGNVRNAMTGRILKPGMLRNGYLIVVLSKSNTRKTCTVHRLVAEAFIPNPLGLSQVNHCDEDKTNNSVDNLEWCSQSYNQAYSHGVPVQQILNGVVIAEFASIRDAARHVGCASGAISNCCNGKQGYNTAKGYTWRFAYEQQD